MMKKKISHIGIDALLEIAQGELHFFEEQKRHFKQCKYCQGEYQKIQRIHEGVQWDKELEETVKAVARDYSESDANSASLDAGWLKFKETLFKKDQQPRPLGKLHVVVEILKNIPKLIQSSFPPASSLMPLPTRGKSSSVQLPLIEAMISSRKITGWIIYFPKQNVSSLLLSITNVTTKEGLAGVALNLFDSKGKKLLGGKTDKQGKIMFHEQIYFGKYVIKSKDKNFLDLEITIKKPDK